MPSYVMKMVCTDRPGILHALSAGVLEAGGNILDSAQFSDTGTGTFCVRTVFEGPETDLGAVRRALEERLAGLEPVMTLRPVHQRLRAVVMVSRLDHCLVDLLYRCQIGELPIEIDAIVSNHQDCRPIAKQHGLPFHYHPVSPDTKTAAEADLLGMVHDREIDLVILARYMQILSAGLCHALPGRVINIHHSFLPGFVGGSPYQQAYDRGVKMIGATAHYVTAGLDDGPIIEQDVVRVSHVHDAADLAAIGRDVERRVLARAVQLHTEDRIALTGSRTVIFS